MKRFSEKHQLQTLSELNVTPLLDLAFVLLIIFMITTPLMENSRELIVPTSKASGQAVPPEARQILSIDRNLNMKLGDEPVERQQLETALRQLKEQHEDPGIIIRAHKELSVQNVIDITDILKRVGITKFGIVSASPDGAQ